MKQVEMNIIRSTPRKRQTGKKRLGRVLSNEETRLTWASDCYSDEFQKGEMTTKDCDLWQNQRILIV
jgi:hypothetical protein